MPSCYLQPQDYSNYGVPSASVAQVYQASTIIDGYLVRPEGLIYVADANGFPIYMENISPSFTLISNQLITPGLSQWVNVSGPIQAVGKGSPAIGETVILDRENPSLTEYSVIMAVNPQLGQVQLQSVQFTHGSGTKLEAGMALFEEHNLPQERTVTNLNKTPVNCILSAQGQYTYPRRGDTSASYINNFQLLLIGGPLGAAPQWMMLDQTQVAIQDYSSGQIWIPPGLYYSYFTAIRVRYVAGYTYASLPTAIKMACANVIRNIGFIGSSALGNIKRAGDTEVNRLGISSSYIDADTRTLIDNYKSIAMY